MAGASEDIVEAIKNSLPKKQRFTMLESMLIIATLGGFLLSILSFAVSAPDTKEIISVTSISFILIVIFVYTYLRDYKGLHRYSQAVSHLHFAAHVTRDAIGSNSVTSVNSAIRNLLDSCSTIFSIVTGKNCSVYIKLLKEKDGLGEIENIISDGISSGKYNGLNKFGNNLIKNYDLNNLNLYSSMKSLLNGSVARYYLVDNIYSEFLSNTYSHPALFDENGERLPTTTTLFGRTKCKNWPLEFRSTLVVPIRFASVADARTPKAFEVFGFLCVDCGSRGVFDHRYAPDLAGAYADLLFVLHAHSRKLSLPPQGENP